MNTSIDRFKRRKTLMNSCHTFIQYESTGFMRRYRLSDKLNSLILLGTSKNKLEGHPDVKILQLSVPSPRSETI